MVSERAAETTRWSRLFLSGLLAGTLAVFGASVGFDLGARLARDQFIYTQGAFTLIEFGLVMGLVTVVVLILELAGWQGSPDRRRGIGYLLAFDALLVWFLFAYLRRRPHPVLIVETWFLGASGLVVLVSAGLYVAFLRVLAGHDRPAAAAAGPADQSAASRTP